MKKTLLTSLMALLPFMASADVIEVDGIYYDVSDSTQSATIVAPPQDNPTGAPVVYSGDISIPEMLSYTRPTDGSTVEYKVVAVGDSAFAGCTGVTSVTMSASIMTIGQYAFAGTALTSVDVPEGVTTINGYAFMDCAQLTTVSLPSTLSSLGPWVFHGCSLETLTCLATDVPNTDGLAFDGSNHTNATLIVPSTEPYTIMNPWNEFGTITATFDPDNPFEPETDYNVLDNLTQMGAWEFIVPVTISHEGPSYAKIDLTPDMITEVNMALASDDGSTSTTLKALASDGILTDSLTAANGYWLDGNGYVCAPDASDRKVSIEVMEADSASLFYLTIQPEAYQKGADVQEHLYFTNGEKYWATNIILQFEEQKYLVAFIADSVVLKSDSLEYGSTATQPSPEPTKTGYTFAGWEPAFEATVTGDATYTALFTINNYKVTFIADGVEIQSETMTYGTAIDAPAAPEKTGYTFTGWDKEVATTVPDSSVTYTAVYTPNIYKVTFIADSVEIRADSLQYGTAITVPEAPAKTGYTFTGWLPAVAETVPADDVTYVAQYSINSYTVTFLREDGVTPISSEAMPYGTAITAPEAPAKTGYTFIGWSPAVAETVPDSSVTYTAQYKVNKYLMTFTVDGAVFQQDSLEYGSAMVVPDSIPVKEGYTFNSWGGGLLPETVPAHDETYAAYFDINSYNWIFMVDDSVVHSGIVAYGSSLLDPGVSRFTVKEGYTFSGWNPCPWPETMPAEDLIIRGYFTINKYLVTFTDVEGTLSSDSLEYAQAITAPTAREKEGYTFIEWVPAVDATVPAHDVTYTAGYVINSYLVTFKADSVTLRADSMAYGTAITAPEAPAKVGYTFTGWSPEVDATVPAKDVTYIAQYSINSYLVTFKTDNDSVISSTTLEYGKPITKPADPTKTGYTFTGWTPEVATTVPDSSVTYTATFSINSYKLVYQVDGVTVDSTVVKYGDPITEREKPTREGADFQGWFGFPESGTMPAHDVTVTGTFSTNAYKVTFIADGSTFNEAVVEYGTAISLPETNPTKEGYTFVGWGEVPETMPATDITLTAEFSINKYLVTFVMGDKTVADSIAYGTPITAPADSIIKKEGYTFKEWSPKVDATVPAHDVTYTAQYTINKHLLLFIAGETVVKSDSLVYGTTIVAPELPDKEAYTGWENYPTTMPDHDVTVYARANTGLYQITFIADGDTIRSDSLAYGTVIIFPQAPEKEGYTFSTWNVDSEVGYTVPAHDVTYTALYNINQYKVTFIIDSVTVKSQTLNYKSNITAPADTIREGYTFSGWSPAVDKTVPAHDVTYTGTFIPNKYLIAFVLDGKTVKSDSLTYGTAITVPSDSITKKTGYTFTGWSPEVDATVPAHDVTYTAQYVINKYLITFTEGGVITKSDSLEYGAEVIAPEIQNKDAYVGWSNLPTTMPAHDVVVEARPNTGLYLVAFVADDMTVLADSMAYGTAITAPEAPAKEGYTFTGWSPAVDETVPAHDVTYIAVYSINSYKVIFIADGKEISDKTMQYGTVIIAPADSTIKKEGYTFTGWSPAVDATVPAKDMTYIAQFTPNSYLVVFMVDGDTLQSKYLEYGSAISAPANPTKEGHTFAGWNPQVDATVPAHDVTYVAEWDIDPVLIEAHDELIAGQTALDQKKASIDANYNAGVTAYNNLLQQFATVEEEAAPFANKFAADTEAIRNKLAALQTPIDSYNQFQVKDFTAEIEELYNERTLLSQQQRIEEEMKNASADLDVLSDSVDAVLAAIDKVAEEVNVLQAAIANATVTPLNGIATVVDPMGGLDAILQNKEDVTKLTITGQMESADFAALLKVVNVEELTLPAVNSKTDSIRLGGLSNLLVVKLEDANTVLGDEVFTGCNPNLMVYAVKGADIGVLNCNVILNGEAEDIVLTDGYPVRITDAFSAQRISYTRSFSKKTYIGQSAGWETLALPFAVENVTTQDGRSIVPFGQKADANFWLATIGENGFNAVDAIEANKPYLIAMPNNKTYDAKSNITGNVTFSATDAEVTPTTVAEPINAYYTFTVVYEGEPDYENIYAINNEDYQTYYPGSVFVRGLRAVRPFEAFITTNGESGAKQRNLIPIGINSATGLMQIAAEQNGQLDGVYSLDGRKVAETTDNLPAGIYIVGGKKYIVR